MALLVGANGADIAKGLYGFSPVLTAIALGSTFIPPSGAATVYAIAGTVFTVIVQGALNSLMTPWGIPTLTLPYVLTMWLFMLAKAGVAPVAHHEPAKRLRR